MQRHTGQATLPVSEIPWNETWRRRFDDILFGHRGPVREEIEKNVQTLLSRRVFINDSRHGRVSRSITASENSFVRDSTSNSSIKLPRSEGCFVASHEESVRRTIIADRLVHRPGILHSNLCITTVFSALVPHGSEVHVLTILLFYETFDVLKAKAADRYGRTFAHTFEQSRNLTRTLRIVVKDQLSCRRSER